MSQTNVNLTLLILIPATHLTEKKEPNNIIAKSAVRLYTPAITLNV